MIKLIDMDRNGGDTFISISAALDLIPERRELLRSVENKIFKKYHNRVSKWVDDLDLNIWTEEEAKDALALAFYKISLIDIWNDIITDLEKVVVDLDATEYIYLSFNVCKTEEQMKNTLNECKILMQLTFKNSINGIINDNKGPVQ